MSAEFNLPHRLKFWDIVIRPWLQERGYTMYEFGVYDEETLTWCYTWPSIVLGVEPPKNNLYAFYDPAADPSELLVEMNPPAYALDSMVSTAHILASPPSPDLMYAGACWLRARRATSSRCP